MGTRDDVLKKALAEQIANYIATHNRYDELDKREVIMEAVWLLTNDIGAAQQYLNAIGVDINLNTHTAKRRMTKRIKIVNDPDISSKDFMKYFLNHHESKQCPNTFGPLQCILEEGHEGMHQEPPVDTP